MYIHACTFIGFFLWANFCYNSTNVYNIQCFRWYTLGISMQIVKIIVNIIENNDDYLVAYHVAFIKC